MAKNCTPMLVIKKNNIKIIIKTLFLSTTNIKKYMINANYQ